MNDLKQTANKALSDGADSFKSFKDEALEKGEELKNKALDVTKIARDKAIDMHEDIVVVIKENPYKSILTAFLAGFLIAKLV